jgi:hypothetical protein
VQPYLDSRENGSITKCAEEPLLVHLMGGKMDVNSEPGKGSEFWFKV